MLAEVILRTKDMYKGQENDSGYELWNRIADFMDGEKALVIDSKARPGKFVFLGLSNPEKNKEVHYMMEQDNMIGCFIDERKRFEEEWGAGDYDPGGFLCLDPENIEPIKEGE